MAPSPGTPPVHLAVFLAALTAAAAVGAIPSPSLPFTVTPETAGRQLVRVSLPFPSGLIGEGQAAVVASGKDRITPALRALSLYPGPARSVRRALVTFPYTFATREAVSFMLSARPAAAQGIRPALGVRVHISGDSVSIVYPGGPTLTARLMAPERNAAGTAKIETVESNRYFLWQRIHLPDPRWPRVLEVRADALGLVAVVAHLERNLPGDGYAPNFGWEIEVRARAARLATGAATHAFAGGTPVSLSLDGGRYVLYHPAAPLKRRGRATLQTGGTGLFRYSYLRAEADERVPMQETAWRRAEFVVAPGTLPGLHSTLQYPLQAGVDWRLWDALYGTGEPVRVDGQDFLTEALRRHREAVLRSVAVGDDWGNVTGYNDAAPAGATFGMNRLNHCAAIFDEGYRAADRRLIEAGIQWCDNFHDLTIWWGEKQKGGTRYNDAGRRGSGSRDDQRTFMWRSNTAVDFCTKGFDNFFIAYEETGDPRMREALDTQVRYSARYVHSDQGECRNIGAASDFMRLFRFTGNRDYLEQALRLFRELRTKLSPDGLFTQGGEPIDPDPPFIDDDQTGYKHPFVKPLIAGYALLGLPALARVAPDESRLLETVRAVADFLAASQDPTGGWRYPHPHSSYVNLQSALQHAAQLVTADTLLGTKEAHLDAIERVLCQRILTLKRTGRILDSLNGWEMATGVVRNRKELYKLYRRPADRDADRDYSEGAPRLGSSSPEGLVYFPEVLRFYLKHRAGARLLEPPRLDDPLGRVLARMPVDAAYQTPGVHSKKLPVFSDRLAAGLTFPLSWLSGGQADFAVWRKLAREKVRECLLRPPREVPFSPRVIAEEDRGSYVARKVVFNVTADSRVLGLLLAPKGRGPFPAVLLLHDHGARFDIGKEKVIRPFEGDKERMKSAREWVDQSYGGRFLGDELAQRGYVCFSTDALNWSDRGGAGYEGQQALASNLLHYGTSLAGLIAHEDLRAAEFVAGLPEVDSSRIAAMGLSMGAFRTWQLAALTDRIAAGVAVCWLATVKGLLTSSNNLTRGNSAYTMTHPGLFNYLDYPDVASIACPKPMLFYNGERDDLFPVPAVRDAYGKMRQVWESQGAGDRLETRLWNVAHVFDREMQEQAFQWLDRQLGTPRIATRQRTEGVVAMPFTDDQEREDVAGRLNVAPARRKLDVSKENIDRWLARLARDLEY